jgi:hypothetical protein
MNKPNTVQRPDTVTFLWVYCAISILVGLLSLAGGITMAALANYRDRDEPEDYIVGGLLAIGGLAVALSHAVPLILKRDETSWRVNHGFLIGYMIVWALVFPPAIICPILFISRWRRQDVKEYFGVLIIPEREQRRQARRDDAWDDAWDRPRD